MDEVLEETAFPHRWQSEDDRRLVRDLLAGRPEAIATLDAWVVVVLRTEFQSMREEWEDLRQEIHLRVFRNLRAGCFHGRSELRTYVHRIARNTGIDLWRKVLGRREQPAGRVDLPAEKPSVREEGADVISRDLLRKILDGVSAEDRRLLELVHGDHLSYAEIARMLGVAEGSIKSRVFRCRTRLLAVRRRLLGHGEA
jgi:RNA polymerase sigma-70 factor (ECF subfamily)